LIASRTHGPVQDTRFLAKCDTFSCFNTTPAITNELSGFSHLAKEKALVTF